jgi:hypothetical protein
MSVIGWSSLSTQFRELVKGDPAAHLWQPFCGQGRKLDTMMPSVVRHYHLTIASYVWDGHKLIITDGADAPGSSVMFLFFNLVPKVIERSQRPPDWNEHKKWPHYIITDGEKWCPRPDDLSYYSQNPTKKQ